MPKLTPTLAQRDAPSTASIALLCLPAIVGTAFFLIGVIWSKIFGLGDAPDPFREPTAGDRAKLAIGFTLFLTCYFGAAFGPILLPLAGWQAFAVTRALGRRSRRAIRAWTFVVLGLVAAALFWGWLNHLDIFV